MKRREKSHKQACEQWLEEATANFAKEDNPWAKLSQIGLSWEKDRIGWCKWTVAVNAAQIRYYEATWTQSRHLPPLVQWYKVQCHPWKWINCRTWYNLQCKTRRYNAILGYGSSVDPGDGDSSTIQNSKSRTSIYRRGTLSTHIVPPRCTLSRPSSFTSLYIVQSQLWSGDWF